MAFNARDMCVLKSMTIGLACSFVLSACIPSPASKKFLDGSEKQDGLNTLSLEMFDRSPYYSNGEVATFASDGLDASVPKTLHFFQGISNPQEPIRSSLLKVQYAYNDSSAPAFFTFAGQNLFWQNNKNYKAFFGYFYTHRAISYVDTLIDQLTSPASLGLVDVEDIAWESHMLDGSSNVVAPNIFPLTVVVDNDSDFDGSPSSAGNTHYCGVYNDNFLSDGVGPCMGSAHLATLDDIAAAFSGASATLSKRIHYYQDEGMPSFNTVDDSDVVSHETFHAIQDAFIPELLGGGSAGNDQMRSVIEGTADFFISALNRSPEISRYFRYNFHALYPWAYAGSLEIDGRDTDNPFYFPDAYMSAPQITDLGNHHANGRVVSGAFHDIVQAASGNTVEIFSYANNCPYGVGECSVQMANLTTTSAYNNALQLLLLSLVKLNANPDKASVGFSGYAEHISEACSELSFWCDAVSVEKILASRGLRTVYRWGDSYSQLYDLGLEGEEDSKGLILKNGLGWVPFMPGGTTTYANDDNLLDPCEVIYVFPNLENQSNSDNFSSLPNWGTVDSEFRGAPIYELGYVLTQGPVGFVNFEHPLGFPDPWNGLPTTPTKGVPIMWPGESIESLFADSSRLFKTYGNEWFDISQMDRGSATTESQLYSEMGWLFQLPEDVGSNVALTFELTYKSHDNLVSPGTYTFEVTQGLTVDDGNSFCPESQ